MDVAFRTNKHRKCANDHRYAQRELGPKQAKLFLDRLTEFKAAITLAELRNLPQAGHHELRGDRKGELSCNLDHPYRLIYVPAHDPVPRKPDNGLDWDAVTAVKIQEIVNYHG